MTGRFISIEGGDGVGKSTQIEILKKTVEKLGFTVVLTREPGGTTGAEDVRNLLLSGSEDKWGRRAEALLFAAARSDHVEKKIRPALKRGDWVISDRYVDSSRAYQSGKAGLSDADILALHKIGSENLLPDVTIVLELTDNDGVERALSRDAGTQDRIGGRTADYHMQVRDAFRAMASSDPERVKLVDASGSIEDVSARINLALADLLEA